MLVRYYQYHNPEPALDLLVNRTNEIKYSNYASELLNSLLRTPDFDMEDSVRKTIAVLRMTGIPGTGTYLWHLPFRF